MLTQRFFIKFTLTLFLFAFGITQINAQQPEELTLIKLLSSLEASSGIIVVSASKQAEPLKETPVPVTVITSEMIERIGARSLKDVLITYVPGMTFVQDHNEVNVAARGIYGSSQQKMLVLLDGHRLNNRAFSEANPDFSISLEKIKQIEVLRGPGSSLYGNVALTAVINIVTKSGKDLDGASVSSSVGNYGQQKLSFVYGKEFSEANELLIWGTHYKADGEEVDIPKEKDYSENPQHNSSAILDGFRDLPSYDIGVKYRFGNFTLLGNTRYSKYVEPFSAGGRTGEPYKYDEYPTLSGVGPGLGSKFTHFDLKYNHVFSNDFAIQVQGFYDQSLVEVYLIINPSAKSFAAPSWNDRDLGIVTQFRATYELGSLGAGNFILGAHLERMEVYDSQFPKGSQVSPGDEVEWNGFDQDTKSFLKDLGSESPLKLGDESIYSGFSQLKHRFNEQWILNLGFRYDYKDRYLDEKIKDRYKVDHVSDLSPRLALIYLPTEKFEAKVSYARSFVDAPYWYRYNTTGTFKGSPDLRPEFLKSFQVTPTINLAGGKFKNILNFFHNSLVDFVWRDNQAAARGEQVYRNAGDLTSWGLEDEFAFIQDAYAIRANLTYQKAIKAKNYEIRDGQIHNVPKWTGNVIFDVNPFYSIRKDVWFNFTARYIGKQLSPIRVPNREDPDKTVDLAVILNAGVSLRQLLPGGLSLRANVYNLLDKEYEQGGSVTYPYPQPGRWFSMQVTYNLR